MSQENVDLVRAAAMKPSQPSVYEERDLVSA